MVKKVSLTVDQIINKEFSVQYKGYVPEEVDGFLDQVSDDFKLITEIETYYETQNKALQRSNAILRSKIDDLEAQLEIEKSRRVVPPNSDNSSNFELIKKIAQLESDLFQAKKEIEQLKK